MRRLVLTVAVAVSACSGGPKSLCTSDSDCGFGGFCDPELKSCLEKQCNPACPAWQICGSQGCVARYGEISVLEPAANGTVDGGVHVHAQLALAQNVVLRDDPATLDVLINGADGGLLTLGTLSATDAGDYAGNAYATYEGPATLVVQYRDASLKSAPVPLTFDQTGPVFAIEVPAPTRRDGTVPGEPNEIDPAQGYANAWKRNESVTFKITSTAVDVDPASVHVSVGGYDGGAGVEGSATTCTTGSGYCGQFTVDLSKPTLNAFRGDFPVVVTGVDLAGNPATADGGVFVTRWNWAADAGGPVQLTPAVASDGTVVVANNARILVALNPDGTAKWAITTPGRITGGPTIGANDRVYVAVAPAIPDAGVSISWFRSDGVPESACISPSTITSSQSITLANIDTETGGPETAVAALNIASTGYFVEARPDDPTFSCRPSGTLGKVYTFGPGGDAITIGAAISAEGSTFFYGDSAGRVQAQSFETSGVFAAKAGWPVNASLYSQGLAVAGTDIVGGGGGPSGGGAFAIPDTGTSVSWSYPDAAMPSSPAHIPAVGRDNFVVVGTDTPELIGAIVGATSGVAMSSSVAGAPAFGADGRLYAVTESGDLVVLNAATLADGWTEPTLFGAVFTSTVLDCDRIGGAKHSGPGRLYVGSIDGRVYSVIVDAHGIDTTTAPWPMFQHDPRLTGNSATPLDPEFRCP